MNKSESSAEGFVRYRIPGVAIRLLLAICCLVSALHCGEVDLRINAARELLEDGNFDQAFEAYERLYQTGVRDPRVLSGLGLILTLQPSSLFAGIDLMEQSLAAESDEEVREQLMLVYLALDRIEMARALIHPDRLSVEQVYSPGITRLRLGLNCLYRPGARTLKNLSEVPEHPRRDFFRILCGLAQTRQKGEPEASIEFWREFRTRANKIACETLAVWPQRSAPAAESADTAIVASADIVGPAEFLSAELRKCREAFPGEISIQRERSALVSDQEGPRQVQSLFDMDVYEPDDPGAELEKRPFHRAPVSEPAESEGPYLPVP